MTDAELAERLRLALTPIVRGLRQHGPADLTPTQSSLLGVIRREGRVTPSALASSERLSPPTVSTVVNVLHERGLVEREADPDDRRVCWVTLSAAGRELLDDTAAVRDAWLAERIAQLDAADREQLAKAVVALEHLGAPDR